MTLVSLAAGVHHCLRAAKALEEENVSAEVVDLRSLVPLDRETIRASVAKTGRLIVVDEGVITAWLVGDGSQVNQGDLVAEVMVEKAQYEIEAPAAGRLTIAKHEDEVVKKGTTIASLDD